MPAQPSSGAIASPAERLRAFAEPYASAPLAHVPILRRFPGGPSEAFTDAPDSDRGLGILMLAAALYRPGGEEQAAALLAGLHARFGTDLFRLNRVPFPRLRDAVEELAAGWDPAESRRVPGILRSACDFFFRTGSLRVVLASDDWEPWVERIATEILWMGAKSALRVKARRFFWMACSVPDVGRRHAAARAFRWPPGEGYLRFHNDQVRTTGTFARARATGPRERLEALRELAVAALPDEPWAVVPALDDYLRPVPGAGFACRAVRGGCRGCPLEPRCPSAPHFLSREAVRDPRDLREAPAGE